MGKNKKKMKVQDGETKHSPNTVFVSNLPFTFTQSQLEKTFSEVGPIRRCFMVTNKGSNEHRGFGFVQFAVKEDANRAVELKNGSSVGGRRIRVKLAMHRAPLDQRRPTDNRVVKSDNISESKDNDDGSSEAVETEQVLHPKEAVKVDNVTKSEETGSKSESKKAPAQVRGVDNEGSGSEKQRVARTIIFGGILNDNMAEDVHLIARECGNVHAVTYPLPEEELEYHGLSREGCKMNASSVLFTSVKSARACVATLHQKKIRGGYVWARQLGGEGSKTQKWKLIIRNLPFEATVKEVKDMFSAVAFVWDVFIPHNSETRLAKGFAFVKFTSKQDAENAIQKFNGKKIGKRTIAVDWAVPKKIFVTGGQSAVPSDDGQETEDEKDEESDREDTKNKIADNNEKKEVDSTSSDTDVSEKEDNYDKLDFDEEADVARKVLNNLVSSSAKESSVLHHDDAIDLNSKPSLDSANVAKKVVPGNPDVTKTANSEVKENEEDLRRTVFISNLPFDVDNEEVKQRFSGFGEVQFFVPVLHQVTKRPRGTGFLKFKAADGVDAAITAANTAPGLGIFLKGRQLKVFRALDKKSAHNMEQEKAKKEDLDLRNLYLAKEGLIVEGTPAAEGVSASDMLKRQELERKKNIKLVSPNFHVSRTRLVIYNLPKSMTEKELKELFIDAVTSRASKQKPVIQQIKVLKASKHGKPVEKNYSRGVAFVEFSEHQHALVALRVLNNNPETFGSEHRPIVEFAIDNIQKLKLRQIRNQHQGGQRNYEEKAHQKNDAYRPDARKDENLRKRKLRGDDVSMKTHKTNQENEVKNEEPRRNGNTFSTGKTKGPLVHEKKSHQDESNIKYQISVKTRNMDVDAMKYRTLEKVDNRGQKRKLRNTNEMDKDNFSSKVGKRSKKNKDPLGRDVVDKLDNLIEKYKSKFSHGSSDRSDSQKQGSRQLRRWFET